MKKTTESARALSRGTATEIRRRLQLARGSAIHRKSRGVTIRTPIVSPTHHVSQLIANPKGGTLPQRTRLPTPTVALTRQLTGPPRNRNLPISFSSFSAVGNPRDLR